jgi:hypothetical protein
MGEGKTTNMQGGIIMQTLPIQDYNYTVKTMQSGCPSNYTSYNFHVHKILSIPNVLSIFANKRKIDRNFF